MKAHRRCLINEQKEGICVVIEATHIADDEIVIQVCVERRTRARYC